MPQDLSENISKIFPDFLETYKRVKEFEDKFSKYIIRQEYNIPPIDTLGRLPKREKPITAPPDYNTSILHLESIFQVS